MPGFTSNLDLAWDDAPFAHFLTRLSAFSRLVLFDKRGTGLSDRVGPLPTLEQRMDDVRAVMDAVGSAKAALTGVSEGGPMSVLFAATYPERTSGLVLYGAYAHTPEPEAGQVRPEAFGDLIRRGWGTGETLDSFAPSRRDDAAFRRWWAKFERAGASPSAALALLQMNRAIDVRHVLPSVRVPTLVLHRSGDLRVEVEDGRALARAIPGARYVELPGADHLPWVGDADRLVAEIEQFLTGSRPPPEIDRVLTTVLFTDIVGSTARAAEMGDRGWRQLMERHDALTRAEIARCRGREVKSLGDGFLATFDGPARAVRCALLIAEAVRPLGLELRAGVHTGEVELVEKDVRGIAVHTAAHVAELAGPGQVLVSGTVRDLVAGSGLRFADLGRHALKGLPKPIPIFLVQADSP